jgi:hypothetical protein
MKVYLVLDAGAYHCCSHESVLGVYRSKEAAMKAHPLALGDHPDLIDFGDGPMPDIDTVVWIQEEEVRG